MSDIKTYKRAVMAKRATRSEATKIAEALATVHPERQYAVEYTPNALQREPWRVISIRDVPEGTPDQNPLTRRLIQERQGQIRDSYEDPLGTW